MPASNASETLYTSNLRPAVLSLLTIFGFISSGAPLPSRRQTMAVGQAPQNRSNSYRRNYRPDCQNVTFTDINESHAFPNHAFRDADHLRRPGGRPSTAGFLRTTIYRSCRRVSENLHVFVVDRLVIDTAIGWRDLSSHFAGLGHFHHGPRSAHRLGLIVDGPSETCRKRQMDLTKIPGTN